MATERDLLITTATNLTRVIENMNTLIEAVSKLTDITEKNTAEIGKLNQISK